MTAPRPKYARSGDIHIAYQVVGQGPVDIIWVPGFISHIDLLWEHPAFAHMLRRLSTFARVVIFDKRGTGLSDRVGGPPTLEERIDDVKAVVDSAQVDKAIVCGNSEGGPMAALFAASYPQIVEGLILYGSTPRLYRADDYPIGLPSEEIDRFASYIERHWGEGRLTDIFVPSAADDPDQVAFMAKLERSSMSPTGILGLLRLLAEIDVRHVLPTIRVPTLVIHSRGDLAVPLSHGRYLADAISGAKFVEIPFDDHGPFTITHSDALVDEVEEFVTGVRPAHETDREFATLLFTDIVSSTAQAATLGDRRWRAVMDKHDALVQRELARFRGRLVNPTGDGLLATFDGPARAVRCAQEIGRHLKEAGIEVRAGLHAGEVERRGEDITGIAINIANRVASMATAGEVLVSRTVTDLVAGSGLEFEGRGEHDLKGVPGRWQLYAVRS